MSGKAFMSRSGGDPQADADATGEPKPWRPPEREAFEQRLRAALAGAEDEEYRANLGIQCWLFMGRVWQRRQKAAQGRSLWNPIRYAGAVIPVVAAGAGGSLVGHVHGTAGTVIGWVALLGGLADAAINAMRPGIEHSVDLAKTAEFEQLYWDVFTYAMVNLRTDTPEDIGAALRRFAKRMEEIALLSGRTTATGS
jgi:hypothetical protein